MVFIIKMLKKKREREIERKESAKREKLEKHFISRVIVKWAEVQVTPAYLTQNILISSVHPDHADRS